MCVCVCDHTQESMHHSVINDLFHTLIIMEGGCVCVIIHKSLCIIW